MKREKYSFFLSLSLSFSFSFPFEYETYPGIIETRVFQQRLIRSRRNLAAFALHWAIFARERKKERKKEKERRRKGGKNARRHPLETKFFRKRISLFGSELCPLSQVFTIRAWGSIEWRRRGYRTVDIDAAIDSILRVKKSRVDARNLFNRVD